MTKPKKLIEVAMPVKEISAESVRDKSIRHGHISTLHLWWARRPLPVCRAVVFASLVPDPLDENCPKQFKEAVELLLGKDNDLPGDPYKPYDDIPHTAIVDKMEDNLRNRLMMFIGKFSDKYVTNEKQGKKTPAKEQLHTYSLIKWDNKNDEQIIGRARQLIFVSHNASNGKSTSVLLAEFQKLNDQIKQAEQKLYSHQNRHIITNEVKKLEEEKDTAIASFLSKMPRVFDPFAGGGAIPLEAARLGCNSYGNDINPVAHIIQKGSCEFPQKYGKPITYSKKKFIEKYGEDEYQKQIANKNTFGNKVNIPNRLVHDIEYHALILLKRIEKKTGHLYPKDQEGKTPMVYYWARAAVCSNPSCKAKIPLLKSPYLSKRRNYPKDRWVFVKFNGNDLEIKNGETSELGFVRNGLICPTCNSVTKVSELKEQFKSKDSLSDKLIALIYKSKNGNTYVAPDDLNRSMSECKEEELDMNLIPYQLMQKTSDLVSGRGWGIHTWS